MIQGAFDTLFLIARPAAGKSEIIDYLRRTPEDERLRLFHIGRFHELDDFPMLWTWFEEDRILEKLGHPRLHTDAEENFVHSYLWDLLIERLSLEHAKRRLEQVQSGAPAETILVEFARGAEHGGFQRAFQRFPTDILRRGAILYIEVSWAESLRKNRARFNPDRPHSILEHALTDEKLARLYREMDWERFRGENPSRIDIQGVHVPYVVFPNEDDVTSDRGTALGARLQETLARLWALYSVPQ